MDRISYTLFFLIFMRIPLSKFDFFSKVEFFFETEEVLELSEVEKSIPKDNEVLIKVHAASLNAIDKLIVRGKTKFLYA